MLRPRGFWFRMRRATRGGLGDSPWVYCELFDTSKNRARRRARARLSLVIGHEGEDECGARPWGGKFHFQVLTKPDSPLVLIKHAAGMVYMERF